MHLTQKEHHQLASLPEPIHQFWISLINETHPLVQLYWLKDLYELVVRWCVALALAYHRAVSQGDFPEHLRDELGSLIERPTLGQWRYILSRLLEETQIDAHALSALRTTQDRLNDASPAGGSYDTSLIALRNLLAHGGGLGPEESTVLLNAHLPKMIAILVSISELPSTVLAQVDNETRVLAGTAGEVPQVDTPDQRDSAWLLTEEGLIGLAPLFHFRRPTCISGDGQLRELSQAPCSQVFMRLDQKQQTFTPVGASRPVVHDLDRELLRERFGKLKVTQDDTPKVVALVHKSIE